MIRILASALLILFISSCASNDTVRFGVIADVQYSNKPARGLRHYSASKEKLKVSLTHLKQLQPQWVLSLGDLIDDKYESFTPLLKICKNSELQVKHLLGNHDYDIKDKYKPQVPELLQMPARYYSWTEKGWRFIILDGNELSTYAHPKGSPGHKRSMAYYNSRKPKPPVWNGGIDKKQITWLRAELAIAEKKDENVILLCHFPIFPVDAHNLWNDKEMLKLIDEYSCVKAWFNGHNHKGNYAERNGVHYITFHGMVDHKTNAYALVEVDQEKIRISGFGREPQRELSIKK